MRARVGAVLRDGATWPYMNRPQPRVAFSSHAESEMKRLPLTPGALYKLLNDELRAKRKTSCQCRMPLPFLIERPDEVSANWRIGTPAQCVQGCDALIGEVAAALWPCYDLRDPTATPVKDPQRRTIPSET